MNSQDTPYFSPEELLQAPIARAAYSDRTAWLMGKLALLAYNPFEISDDNLNELKSCLGSGGFQLVRTFNTTKTGTQAYLCHNNLFGVLVFRGTEICGVDLRTDLDLWPILSKGSEIHSGFNEAWESTREECRKATNELNMPFYVTGHSLGAALATLAARDLEGDNLAACYTFGSPRVGDYRLDWEIKTPVYRVVNKVDGVTLVPFPFLFFHFHHVGDVRYFDSHGRLNRSIHRFFYLCSSVIWALITKWKFALAVDHSMDGYVAVLENYAEARNPKLHIASKITPGQA
ncbi:MAG: hypothetical protein PHD76_10915 [Methylacidiphilales bacterium]|nr:hypothetical protein [Candidatus Methylacidiphilales bacterium]